PSTSSENGGAGTLGRCPRQSPNMAKPAPKAISSVRRSSSERPTSARPAQHAAGNFDNHQVEIVCAASAQVNGSVLYQCVDTANRSWPTGVAPGGGEFSVGQRVARSLPERWPAVLPRRGEAFHSRFKAINSRTGGQPGRCPF